ncbi:alpha/beta fold hydrolase [Paraburkholderia sp.]|uniref:alpha/beta fold hydrolase n=1 Tax=Paraburkholderia sp. TaxID=1926495 RepID=UPI003D6FFC13
MHHHPPVVFIHGFIGTLAVNGHVPSLPERTSIAPDLLGYGAWRNIPPESISLAAQAEHVHGLIEVQFGSTPVDVVGHSVGGAIAMLLAHAHPQSVRRIVNVEGNFTLADAFWSASVGRMSEQEADAMLAGFRSDPLAWLGGSVPHVTPDMHDIAAGWLAHQPASTLRAMGQSVVTTTGDNRYLAMVREVFERHPVYLLAGKRSRDEWNAPDWAIEQCASFQTLEDCGHLMMLEQPDAFVAAIERCLG